MIALRWSTTYFISASVLLCAACGCNDMVFQPPKQQAFNRAEYQQQLQEQRQRLADEMAGGGQNQTTAQPFDSSTSYDPQAGTHDSYYEEPTYSSEAHSEHDEHDEHDEYTTVHDAPAESPAAADDSGAHAGHTHSHDPPGTYLPPVATGAGAPKSAGGLKFLTKEPTGEVKLRAGVALAQTLPTGTAMMFSVDYTFTPGRSGKFGWAIYGNSKAMVRPIKLNARGNLMTYHPAVKPADGPFECQIVEIVGSNLRPLSARHRMK